MTPQLALVPKAAAPGSPDLTRHITEEQFGELLAATSRTSATLAAEAHLRSCEQCAAELASLRESLSFFRQASTAYANNELRQMPQIAVPARRPLLTPATQATWAFAAAATFLIALLPMQAFRQHSVRPGPAAVASDSSVAAAASESDEALLRDINQEESASVPAPMQALADPTAGGSSGIAASVQISDQRKD